MTLFKWCLSFLILVFACNAFGQNTSEDLKKRSADLSREIEQLERSLERTSANKSLSGFVSRRSM
jgi:hypothetical protein